MDNDCDGETDEDDALDAATWYADADNDGFGDPESAGTACEQPSGFVGDATDCDDGSKAVHAEADELCNGSDDDCDGETDEDDALDAGTWYADADGDGFGDAKSSDQACYQPSGYEADGSDCDDTDDTINPQADETWYDGIDQDCDGWSDYDQDYDDDDGAEY